MFVEPLPFPLTELLPVAPLVLLPVVSVELPLLCFLWCLPEVCPVVPVLD